MNGAPPSGGEGPSMDGKGSCSFRHLRAPRVVFYGRSCLLCMWVAVAWSYGWSVDTHIGACMSECVCGFSACVLAQQKGISGLTCVWERTVGPGGAGISGGPQGGVGVGNSPPPPPPFRAMTRQVMWPLVLTGALGSRKQEGSVLGPHACFIVCALGCLTAECRQINPEASASTHTNTNRTGPRRDRGRTVSARLWELTQQQRRRVVPHHLSVCMPPLSSGSSFVCFSWQGEKGKYVSLSCSRVPRLLRGGCKSNN